MNYSSLFFLNHLSSLRLQRDRGQSTRVNQKPEQPKWENMQMSHQKTRATGFLLWDNSANACITLSTLTELLIHI